MPRHAFLVLLLEFVFRQYGPAHYAAVVPPEVFFEPDVLVHAIPPRKVRVRFVRLRQPVLVTLYPEHDARLSLAVAITSPERLLVHEKYYGRRESGAFSAAWYIAGREQVKACACMIGEHERYAEVCQIQGESAKHLSSFLGAQSHVRRVLALLGVFFFLVGIEHAVRINEYRQLDALEIAVPYLVD